MSIASEIQRINTNIANAYTSIENKGGTLPQTQNSANLATAIDSISGGSYDITAANQLPAPVSSISTYNDANGDLNITWVNPTDEIFNGQVVVVRKPSTIPTLPIENQDYDILTNNATQIHYSKSVIPENQVYGFLVLPLNENGEIQTIINNQNKITGKSVSPKRFVEILLPSELQSQTDLHSYITKKGVVYLSSKSSSVTGLWRLDKLQDRIVKIYNSGYNWQYFCEDKYDNTFISSSASGSGILRYDVDNDTCTQVYNTSYDWKALFCDSQDNIFASGSNSSSDGILKYNSTLGEFEKIYNGYADKERWFYEDSNGNVLLTPSEFNNNYPVLKYDSANNIFVPIYTTSSTSDNGSFSKFFEDSQGNVFVSVYGGNYSTYRYDSLTNTLTSSGLSTNWGTNKNFDGSGDTQFFEDSRGNLFVAVNKNNTSSGTYNWLYKYDRRTNLFTGIASLSFSGYQEVPPFYFYEYNDNLFVLVRYNLSSRSNVGMVRYDYNSNQVKALYTAPEAIKNSFNFKCYTDKLNNLFFWFELTYTSGSNPSTQSYTWNDTNKSFVDISATLSGINTVNFNKVIELEAGELYISDTSSLKTNGLYKYNYSNQIFVKVSNYGYNYRLVKNTNDEAIFGVEQYTNDSNSYSIKYDKNNTTYTQTYQSGKNGIKLASGIYLSSYKSYVSELDTIYNTDGNYTNLTNIKDGDTYNYALSLNTASKYLIYNT